jgi:hypothetical protein
MLILLSPSKTLDTGNTQHSSSNTLPRFLENASELVNVLKMAGWQQLAELMKISPALARMNADRFAEWDASMHHQLGKPALFTYKGDVYEGLNAEAFTAGDHEEARIRLRILSGLYGYLRPFDLIMPHRLEMGTRLSLNKAKDLYEFWGGRIRDAINEDLLSNGKEILINLASQEYFKSVRSANIKASIITPEFRDYKNGEYKMISFFAKRARGLMARYLIAQRVKDASGILDFESEGYSYNDLLSEPRRPVFTRG